MIPITTRVLGYFVPYPSSLHRTRRIRATDTKWFFQMNSISNCRLFFYNCKCKCKCKCKCVSIVTIFSAHLESACYKGLGFTSDDMYLTSTYSEYYVGNKTLLLLFQ